MECIFISVIALPLLFNEGTVSTKPATGALANNTCTKKQELQTVCNEVKHDARTLFDNTKVDGDRLDDAESPRENNLSSFGNSLDEPSPGSASFRMFRGRRSKKKNRQGSDGTMSDEGSLECSFNCSGEQNEGIDSLVTKTKFTRTEIQRMYRGFKNDCPNGYADKETFKKIYAQFFPHGESGQYAGLVFNAFDLYRRGKLSYENFVMGLSTALHGSQEDKLKWTFHLYDVDGDGVISKEDLNVVVSAVHSLIGSTRPEDDLAIKEQVLRIFEVLDKSDNGYITQEMFIDNCANDECISQSLAMFDTQR